MTKVVINDQKYVLEDIVKLAGQAARIGFDPKLLQGVEDAKRDPTLTMPIVIACEGGYKALVMPATIPDKPFKHYHLMSKIILKKAKVVVFIPQPQATPQQDNWNRPYRMHPTDQQRLMDRVRGPESNNNAPRYPQRPR